jgi:hypothetical protein
MRPEPLLWLDEIGDEDRPRVGGKAFALARLRRLGLPVPDGFVLTASRSLDDSRRAALGAAYRRLGGRVAVRSSSTAEDTAEASFAGQYQTILDVAGERRWRRPRAMPRGAGCRGLRPRHRSRGLDVMAVPSSFVEPGRRGRLAQHPRESAVGVGAAAARPVRDA